MNEQHTDPLSRLQAEHPQWFRANGAIQPHAPADFKAQCYNAQIASKRVELTGPWVNAKAPHEHRCLICSATFTAIPKEFKRQASGCPACQQTAADDAPTAPPVKGPTPADERAQRNQQIIALFDQKYPISAEEIVEALGLSIRPSTVANILQAALKSGQCPNAARRIAEEKAAAKRQRELDRIGESLPEGEDFVILDSETTGLGDDDEIIELTVISSSGEVLLDTLLKPRKRVPAEATAIHGISNAHLKHAPTIEQVLARLCAITRDKNIVAYNAGFDKRLLQQSLEKAGCETPRRKWICAMKAYIHKRHLERWPKLVNAAKYVGFPTDHAHRAISDCFMTLAVIHYVQTGERNALALKAPEPTPLKRDRTMALWAAAVTLALLLVLMT